MSKIIQDNIHGFIKIPNIIMEIIDTPEYQRLRNVKQLGSCYYVFMGARHGRLEHCIGTMHIASKLIDNLNKNGMKINKEDKLLIQIAGLCHDLGQNIYSHIYEDIFLKKCKITDWTHEKMSIKLLNYIIKKYRISLTDEQIDKIENMINPTRDITNPIYSIICNKIHSMDVDKLDYLMRDSYNLGIKKSVDIDRLINNCRIIDNKICYNIKIVNDIYDLFNLRYNMYNQFYLHKSVRAIDHMIADILIYTESIYNYTKIMYNPETFYRMDDSIIERIYNKEDNNLTEDQKYNLNKAKELINRIKTRNIYKFIGEIVVNRFIEIEPYYEIYYKKYKISNIEYVIDQFKLNYSMKEIDPVTNMNFYKNEMDNKIFKIDKLQISCLLPDKFEKYFIRIYCKSQNKNIINKCEVIYNDIKNEIIKN